MTEVLQTLASDPALLWLAAAGILIIIEIMAPSTYALWLGLAAAVVGFFLLFWPGLPVYGQFAAFAGLTIAAGLLGPRIWPRISPDETDAPQLSRRGDQLVGELATVSEAFMGGQGKVHVGDTLWLAKTRDKGDYEVGQKVRIVDVDNTTLYVRAVQ